MSNRRRIGILILIGLAALVAYAYWNINASRAQRVLEIANLQVEVGSYNSAVRLAVVAAEYGRSSNSAEGATRLIERAIAIGPRIFSGHTQPITDLAFDTENDVLATGALDGTVRFWDTESGNVVRTFMHDVPVRSIELSQDLSVLAVGLDSGAIVLWSIETGEELSRLPGHHEAVYGLDFGSADELLASGSMDGSVTIWNVETGELSSRLLQEGSGVYDVAFHPSGERVIAASADSNLYVWSLDTSTLIATMSGHEDAVLKVAFDADGERVISGSADRTLRIWDADNGWPLDSLEGHSGYVGAVALSADGRLIATGSSDSTIRIWNASTGELRQVIRQDNVVWALAFDRNSEQFATGSMDAVARIWAIHLTAEAPESVARLQRASSSESIGDAQPVELACAEVLVSPDIHFVSADGEEMWLRSNSRITALDAALVPFLQGREGEDLCSR